MPSLRQALLAPNAPKPNGNYSHAVRSGNMLYLAGWMGDDPTTGQILSQDIEAQTERAILNIKAVIEAAGLSLDAVVSRRIYLTDIKEFRKVDAAWARHFEEPYPVSTCVQVSGLAKEGARVELEVVAEFR